MSGAYTEDTLIQQTTAEYLERQLGWNPICFYIQEPFGPTPQGMK